MNFIIPSSTTKRSLLIFGLFNIFDLILCASGVSLSLIMLLIIDPSTIPTIVLDLAPGLISVFLIAPVPNYHNMLTLIKSIIDFYILEPQHQYKWKGWCMLDGDTEQK